MSRNSTTGIYTRVSNSFSQPVTGTTIDPSDADTFFDDVEAAMNSFIGTSTTSLAIGTGAKTFTTQTGKTFIPGTFVQAISRADAANYMYGTITSYDAATGALVLDVAVVGGSGTLADWNIFFSGARGGVGVAATATAGTTTTGKAATSAAVSNSGSSSAAVFDFTIPRGADAGLRYAFEASTSMAAPASGGLRLNNAALASVTAIAVNATNSDAIDVSDFIATWDDSTNTVKGFVEVRKESSGAVLGLYQLTSVTDNTAWLEFAVTYVSGSGSFTVADSLYLTPYRTGNAGTNGAVAISGTPTVNQFANWTDATTIKGTSITGLVKGNGASAPTAATAGTDYYNPGGTDVAVADGGTGSSTAAGARTNLSAAALSQTTEFVAGYIKTPANQDYRLIVKIPHGGTITETVTRSESGTCTATFKVNTTALGGTANSVSSTEQAQAQASSNTFVADDDIVVTISSNSSCVGMSFTIKYTRTLL